MIPGELRILVCTEPIDMRLYAERAVMLSFPPKHGRRSRLLEPHFA
jgi:hypothetical protein